MKFPVVNIENKEVDFVDLPENMFQVEWKPVLVWQALNAYLANQRQPWAHTKDRGEVSGSGKKPWRQKHTGRARHGSRRSPIWKGGGVAFGPRKEKDYSQKINKKMKKLALFSALSRKLKDDEVRILEELSLKEPKTQKAKESLANIVDLRKSLLFVAPANKKSITLALRNLPKVSVVSPDTLNIYNVLSVKNIIFEKEGLLKFIERYKKEK